jgi:hypothetical protein
MINRRLLLIAAIALLFTAAYAQKKSVKEKTPLRQAAARPPVRPMLEVAIGRSGNLDGGVISEKDFDAIAPKGIHIKDPQGAFIEGFSFTYAERNVYEDSAANQKLVTEYFSEYCIGDTLSPIISQTIGDRTKPGDTAYYDDIHIRLPDGKTATGKSMKFVIAR